jgi:hypothetical protein
MMEARTGRRKCVDYIGRWERFCTSNCPATFSCNQPICSSHHHFGTHLNLIQSPWQKKQRVPPKQKKIMILQHITTQKSKIWDKHMLLGISSIRERCKSAAKCQGIKLKCKTSTYLCMTLMLNTLYICYIFFTSFWYWHPFKSSEVQMHEGHLEIIWTGPAVMENN